VSDASGEDEIYVVPQDGSAQATRVTTGGDNYKYELRWSPDSQKILWSDRKLRLQFVDLAGKAVTDIPHGASSEIRDCSWSPDSKWIAYSKPEPGAPLQIYLYSLDQRKIFEATDSWYSSS